jgi:hypothetical protein
MMTVPIWMFLLLIFKKTTSDARKLRVTPPSGSKEQLFHNNTVINQNEQITLLRASGDD